MMNSEDDRKSGVFHEGETAIQERVGVREKIAEFGQRAIRDHMPDQHRAFFTQLPFILAGALDSAGQPWSTVLAGPAGFIQSPDPKMLVINTQPTRHDPLAQALVPGASVGLLGIEPHTRRRNRLNGIIQGSDEPGLHVAVSQSFGNCPKYIQARKPEYSGDAAHEGRISKGRWLDPEAQAKVRSADTFYIASAYLGVADSSIRSHGVDVSHRGGKPGFVRVESDGSRLTAPDFVGNYLFNTLGNLLLNPRAGLLFIDFATGGLLHVAVRGSVIWDGPQLQAFAGAQRLVQFDVDAWQWVDGVLPLRWGPEEMSPFLAKTGGWDGLEQSR